MEIDCPRCKKTNQLPSEKDLSCSYCQSKLGGHRYQKYMETVSLSFFVAVGAIGYHLYDEHQERQHRYPLEIEQALLNYCVGGDSRIIQKSYLKIKLGTCMCALKKVQADYGINDIEDPKVFLRAFSENQKLCLQKKAD